MIRCNRVHDCPEKEDENECSTCPGFYRCLSSQVCLLPIHLCDGFAHCPHTDDELLCDLVCPQNCTCHGLAFTCMSWLSGDLQAYPDLRYLDVSGGGGEMVERLQQHALLIHLSVTGSHLTHFINVSFPNLNSLDLRYNRITCLSHIDFSGLKRLRVLLLGGNPLVSAVVRLFSLLSATPALSVLDLSNSRIPEFAFRHLSVFPNLHTLNLSGCSTQRIVGTESRFPSKLTVLDLRGCPINAFPSHVFRGLSNLQAVYASDYKLCCVDQLPEGFNLHNCLADSDRISDCSRLLKDDTHAVFRAMIAVLAVLANVAGCVVHLVGFRARVTTFRALMLHLCVSDGLMGVHVTIICVADRMFRGHYHWQDSAWRRSAACHLSGFLSVLSSQVSSGITCLVMMDGMVKRCERIARIWFHLQSVHLLSAATWLAGVIVAMVTTFRITALNPEGSEHALCTPMLVFHSPDAGSVLGGHIIFNCMLHALTAAGEVYILCLSFCHSDATHQTPDEETERFVQKYIATSKVLCWFIVSLPVTLGMANVTLPADVLVSIVVFVLPLNAALNPLLLAIAMVVARRRQAQEARIMKILAATRKHFCSATCSEDTRH